MFLKQKCSRINSAPRRVHPSPSNSLMAMHHVLILGRSFTESTICHIAPRLPGNYSSDQKRQHYLICTPVGPQWMSLAESRLCSVLNPKSTQLSWWMFNQWARVDKGTIRLPVLFSVERTDFFLRADQTVATLAYLWDFDNQSNLIFIIPRTLAPVNARRSIFREINTPA